MTRGEAIPRYRKRKPRRRTQASASARGYGHAHQKLRKALLAALVPGTPCPQVIDGRACGQPMYPWQPLALGHTDDRTQWIGLVHAACNARDAAIRGNRMRERVPGKTAGKWRRVPGARTVTVRSRDW